MPIKQQPEAVVGTQSLDEVKQLLQTLKTDDLDTLNEGLKKLTHLGSDAVPTLLECLSVQDEELRKHAAFVLGFIGTPECMPPLVKTMQRDASNEVKYDAAWSLRNFPTEWLAQHILEDQVLAPDDPESLCEDLENEDWEIRWLCTLILAEQPEPTCLPALQEVALRDDHWLVRCSAISALTRYPVADCAETLCTCIGDLNDLIKIEAITAVGFKQIKTALPALLKQAEAYNENVRATVCSVLGMIGETHAIQPLLKAVTDKSDMVRINALMALLDILGKAPQPKMTPLVYNNVSQAMLKALSDPNRYVVRNAVRILGLVGTEDALRAMIALIKNEKRTEILVNLIQAVGLLGDKRASKVLIKLVYHNSWEVRFAAVKSVGALQDPKAYGALVVALKDPSFMVKEQAAYALGLLGNKKAIKILENLQRQHPYNRVKKIAANAIERLMDT